MRLWILAAAAAATLTTAASAQPYGRGGTATLYELPNFQGRQYTVTGEVSNLPGHINDRARSARFEGRWLVCEHADFRGNCQELSGDVPSLHVYGLAERVSSLQPVGRGGRWDDDWRGPGGPGGGWGRERGVEGARTVFYAYPTIRGADIAAGSTSANEFCRRNGHAGSVYYDSSERSGRAVDHNGRFVGASPVLRDLLCRRY